MLCIKKTSTTKNGTILLSDHIFWITMTLENEGVKETKKNMGQALQSPLYGSPPIEISATSHYPKDKRRNRHLKESTPGIRVRTTRNPSSRTKLEAQV